MTLREQLAVVGNNIEALDRTLETLGYKGDLKTVAPEATGWCSSRRAAPVLHRRTEEGEGADNGSRSGGEDHHLEGKDPRDRRLRNEWSSGWERA